MKEWLPIVIQVLTPVMVLYMGVELNDKRDHDKALLREVKDIKVSIHESAVIFEGMTVKFDNLERRVTKIENKLENVKLK